LRSTHDRKLKKSGITVDIYREFNPDAWAEYEDIYSESWKSEEGSPEFLRAMFEHEGNCGALRIGIARLDGRAVAAQLWTVEGGSAIIHKLAYRESAAEHSPGTILTTAMFRHVIDQDKVSIIDYGTGDDAYKADWMDTRNILHDIELYNVKTISGLFGALKAMITGVFRKPGLS
jgi:CelD/BcsL family acetyltransferase involved in cellulose biosynthesis